MTFVLSQPRAVSTLIIFTTSDGTARELDHDYRRRHGGSISIRAGQTTAHVNVWVRGDTRVEPKEDFYVKIVATRGVPIGDADGVVTIRNAH